jgi:hypothetical protein
MDTNEMENMTSAFFQNLYTKDDSVAPDGVTNLVNAVVTDAMNEALCATYTEKEISDALFQIGPLKAPGPDGFPARFLQRN